MLAACGGKLTLTVFKCTEDIAVTGVTHIVWHSPDVDCRGKAECARVNDRGVWAVDVASPVPAVTEDGQPATSAPSGT